MYLNIWWHIYINVSMYLNVWWHNVFRCIWCIWWHMYFNVSDDTMYQCILMFDDTAPLATASPPPCPSLPGILVSLEAKVKNNERHTHTSNHRRNIQNITIAPHYLAYSSPLRPRLVKKLSKTHKSSPTKHHNCPSLARVTTNQQHTRRRSWAPRTWLAHGLHYCSL